jgi:hypothetical protein
MWLSTPQDVCGARPLLTTKAVAWLWEALERNWTEVRPTISRVFAFGALSPAWPRRALWCQPPISGAKPLLSTFNIWKSRHAADDAPCVPAWDEFPPLSPVLLRAVQLTIDLPILRAAEALRLMNLLVQNPH